MSLVLLLGGLGILAVLYPDTARVVRVTGGGTQLVPVELVSSGITPDIVPGRLVVDAGTHLVLDVVNKDSEVHDLAVHGGPRTAMLRAGQSQRLDVGVVTRDLDAWCTVGQHKLLGMTLDIRVAGRGR